MNSGSVLGVFLFMALFVCLVIIGWVETCQQITKLQNECIDRGFAEIQVVKGKRQFVLKTEYKEEYKDLR